jgi:hypothetical protein
MDPLRRNEIAYQAEKRRVRLHLSLSGIADAKRQIGNLVNEPEMKAVNVTKGELLMYMKLLSQEVFDEQMAIL